MRKWLGRSMALVGTVVVIPTGVFAALAAIIFVYEMFAQPKQFLGEIEDVMQWHGTMLATHLALFATVILGLPLFGLLLIWIGTRLRAD